MTVSKSLWTMSMRWRRAVRPSAFAWMTAMGFPSTEAASSALETTVDSTLVQAMRPLAATAERMAFFIGAAPH